MIENCEGKLILKEKKMYTIIYFMDYGKSFGGAANTLLQQACLMKKAGHKITVFFSDYFGQNMNEEYKRIYALYDIEMKYATYQISSQPEDIDVICLDENYEKLKDIIKGLAPDILHSVQLNPMAELIGRELSIPHIMNVYPLLPEFFSLPYMDIFPHYHICDSWYWAKRWHEYLDTDFVCIRTTVHIDTAIKKNVRKRIRYICVGLLDTGKNQLNVIKAFHKAMKKGISGELLFYGYAVGPYAQLCKDYIRENMLADSIKIQGFSSNMESVYKDSDVLICGSVRESYPNAISEAMAYGLVILSTPVAGVPEVIKDGINGYLADGYTAEEICTKILELHQDIGREKLEEIKNNACETYELNHSPKIVTENILQYYNHVIVDNKKRIGSSIMISDIRQKFATWKDIFYQNYDVFTKPQEIGTKIWYLFHIRDILKSALKKKFQFYIWGAGEYGSIVKEMANIFLPEIPIFGFLDSKKTGKFGEYKIYCPSQVLEKRNIIVFVALINGQSEVIQQLKNSKLLFNRDYFILAPRSW